ncbi:protoporphyrinogen oxidase HemJ [Halomonas sp. KAO]|uniref:protoporphyrinogen oxidase HemJ n=1 Tax=unclassified Halomonas TaxID=2609666 RepID=UPI00189E006B|nr:MULTISPECIES: protoporphyrinogen oxidase HemJ [unclassified Halomonas]MBF7053662.1 protoporphyrinogen oxidase HemJ [Halomonas sp. KAO]MDT0500941.1 protoporphyrinogen oxidase HemJ [Halomonas sp. PAR7]MDT0512677.1 protoporphyrinogen oxidase HemJ [Halomonas sp. LES1]MDT0592005.1 protoporphyrinogen oxidase HemJ [Halomonas sp. PAR8]
MYLWFKALHLIAMVTWFAAMFYLPRLYVYHAKARDRGEQQAIDHFLVMERKLYRGIMTPSMIAVLLFGGIMLVLNPGWLTQGWIHAKLLLVALLVGYHHVCLIYLKQFAEARCRRGHVFFRWFNELPVIALLIIIFLAVLKPF